MDPQIPYTAKNRCAAILLDEADLNPDDLPAQVIPLMRANFEIGSDPGLAIAVSLPPELIKFGQRAQQEVVN